MAKTVKMCDMNSNIAASVFEMLNAKKVHVKRPFDFIRMVLVTDVEPKDLIYPEGWYYAKGSFRNNPTSSMSRYLYHEIPMVKSDGTSWKNLATYCTLED